MANTATLVSNSPNFCTYLLTGDGTQVGPTITNATILANLVSKSPLWHAWNATYANQAAMRAALLGGSANCRVQVQLVVAVNDVTAEENQISVDVDTDAVTATKAEINIGMSDTTGQIAYMHLIHNHTIIQ